MDPIKDVLTDGKIRVSYGVNGTQPSVYYGYKSWYKWGFFYNGTNGSAISGIANENLKWEKNKALNIGIDLNFWNRLSLTFDYYTRTTSDLISICQYLLYQDISLLNMHSLLLRMLAS